MKKYLGQLIAIAIMIILAIWMYSGQDSSSLMPSQRPDFTASSTPRVQARTVLAESIQPVLEASAQTKAARSVQVSAQAHGEIEAILVTRGARVETGDVLARIAEKDIPDRLNAARALERQRLSELEAARRLVERGLNNTTNLTAAEAGYADAIAQRRNLEVLNEHLTIRAPFAGVVETIDIEVGSFIQTGTRVASINDFNPLYMTANISEKDIGRLTPNQTVRAEMITGEKVNGTLVFIGTRAQDATRTFTVEASIDETLRSPTAGMTAKLFFPLETVSAHFITPALLTLDKAGNLGIKIVNLQQQVELVNVEIVKSSTEGVWVSGLPRSARIITVGQGFVEPGEHVEVVTVDNL